MFANKKFSTTEKRIEIKEVFRPRDLVKLQRALLLSRFSFKSHYPKRKINSIYYDTSDYKALEESIEGGSLRRKVESDGMAMPRRQQMLLSKLKIKRVTCRGNCCKRTF